MLINSLKTNTNPIHIKNHQTAGKTVNKSPQTVPIKNSVLYTPKPNELCSRFNINFTSRLDEDKKLDEFCLRLESKIKEMTTPKDPEIASWAMTPEYLDLINETFKKDGIRQIYDTGISANAMLNYLSKRYQLQLNPFGKQSAFIVDKLSLDYIKNTNAEFFHEIQKNNRIKFYCLDTNEKETQELIKEFNKLTNNSFEVTRIKRPENSDFAKTIDAKRIKAIIKGFASAKFETKEQQSQFIDVITRYLDNNFLAFSYATLCEKLKELYKKIEEQVKAQGKTMDDVIYVVPNPYKSYGLINYLYAKTNSVPRQQFKTVTDIRRYEPYESNNIYVIMDDLCASGDSVMSDIYRMKNINRILLLAPIIACQQGLERIKGGINTYDFKKLNTIYGIKYDDLGSILDKFWYIWDFNFNKIDKKGENTAREYMMKKFKDFNIDDAEFLLKKLRCGHSNMQTFINFPYMIPDNSSELNAFFGEYFLNNDNQYANKAITILGENPPSRVKEYNRIKEIIENYYSNNP